MKTTLPLALALLVSVAFNVALLRREPTAAPAPRLVATTARASSSPSPAPVEMNADVLLLQEQVRRLREQLTVAQAKVELDRSTFPEDVVQPDARELQRLLELLGTLLEYRQKRGPNGEVYQDAVLTPENRNAALGAIEDYLGLEGAARRSFRDLALTALHAYRRNTETDHREFFAADKAGENDEFFEDGFRRKQAVMELQIQRQDQWKREHAQPLCTFLDRRDGVRPGLLSDKLTGILMDLGAPEER